MLRLKHLVYRADALPQNHLRLFDLLFGKTAHRLIEVPLHHFIERDAHIVAGVTAQVLIGKEEDLLALIK